MSTALYEHLKPAFTSAAKWYARTGYEADDIEQEMWRKVFESGAGVVHRCGPLLSQKPAYIAKWAARYAVRRLQRDNGRELVGIYESVPAPQTRAGNTFFEYVEQLGEEWQIDVTSALEVIAETGVSLDFEAYIRALEPHERRIAVLLLSGLKRSHIEKQKLAPRRKTEQIYPELIQALRVA